MTITSRVSVLLSTVALGGVLLTMPIMSQTATVSASTTTQLTSNALALSDGTYQVPLNVYKTGTTNTSAMMQYMNNTAVLTIANGTVKIDVSTKSQADMDMMTSFSLNNYTGVKQGTHWLVSMPTSVWQNTMASHMVIDVPLIGWHEEPNADFAFNTANATKLH